MSRTIMVLSAMMRKNVMISLRTPASLVARLVMHSCTLAVWLTGALLFVPADSSEAVFQNGISIVSTLLYGFILWTFVFESLWTVGYNTRIEQFEGTLESLYLTPSHKFLYLISRVAEPLLWTGLTGSLILVGVHVIFGQIPMENYGLGAYTFLFTLSGIFGFGFFCAACSILLKEASMGIANLAQFIIILSCGMLFPFRSYPEILQYVSRAIPFSYCVDIFRSTLIGFPQGFPELAPPTVEIVIVTAWGVLMPLLGYAVYRLAEHRVRLDGTLADF